MRVYISGPMTGYRDYNKPAFLSAENKLRAAGYEVFNPASFKVNDDFDIKGIALIDLAALSECDYIYLLDGWQKSKGARAEYEVAKWLNIPRIKL